jgi:hypothetical protein
MYNMKIELALSISQRPSNVQVKEAVGKPKIQHPTEMTRFLH